MKRKKGLSRKFGNERMSQAPWSESDDVLLGVLAGIWCGSLHEVREVWDRSKVIFGFRQFCLCLPRRMVGNGSKHRLDRYDRSHDRKE